MSTKEREIFAAAVKKAKATLDAKNPKDYEITCYVRWVCVVAAPNLQAAEQFADKWIEDEHFLKMDEPDETRPIQEGSILESMVEVNEDGRPIGRGYSGLDKIGNDAVAIARLQEKE